MANRAILFSVGILAMLTMIAIPDKMFGLFSGWLYGFRSFQLVPDMAIKIMGALGMLPVAVALFRIGEAGSKMRTKEVGAKELLEWLVLLLFIAALNLVVGGPRSCDGLQMMTSGEKPLVFLITLSYSMLLALVSMINRKRFSLTSEDIGQAREIKPRTLLLAGALGGGAGLYLAPLAFSGIGGANDFLYFAIAKPLILAGLVFFCFGYTYNLVGAITNIGFAKIVAAFSFAVIASPVWWWHIGLNFLIGLLLVWLKDKLESLTALWLVASLAASLPALLNGLGASVVYILVLPVIIVSTVGLEIYVRRGSSEQIRPDIEEHAATESPDI
jgi:hypothetical protein